MLPCHTGGAGEKVAGVLRWTKKVSRCVIREKEIREKGKRRKNKEKRKKKVEKKREEEERKNK